jgi:hypothetical protein
VYGRECGAVTGAPFDERKTGYIYFRCRAICRRFGGTDLVEQCLLVSQKMGFTCGKSSPGRPADLWRDEKDYAIVFLKL